MPTRSTFRVRVTDEQGRRIRNAEIQFLWEGNATANRVLSGPDQDVVLEAEHPETDRNHAHRLRCEAFGVEETKDVRHGETVHFQLTLQFQLSLQSYSGNELVKTDRAVEGRRVLIQAASSLEAVEKAIGAYEWEVPENASAAKSGRDLEVVFSTPGTATVRATIEQKQANSFHQHARMTAEDKVLVAPADEQRIGGQVDANMRGSVGVRLHRTAIPPTLDQALWAAIRNRTHAISFNQYNQYMHRVLYGREGFPERRELGAVLPEELDSARGVNAYHALKYVTEAFLLHECGVFISGKDRPEFGVDTLQPGGARTRDLEERLNEYLGVPPRLPYIRRVIEDAFPWLERKDGVRDPVLWNRIDKPLFIELFHTYWLEEGMLMQSMNAITQRFQNVRAAGDRDPLANFELDPLRRISNWIWGYTRDEINRLTVRQRGFEYLHQYGLPLFGKAAAGLEPADNRSKFLEAFHNLLYQSSLFFKQDDQTTIIPDAYPLLNSLKEVHLILAQGAHNAFGDFAWTARVETLVMQFILAQPAMADFLQRRVMVPYHEAWMPQVDAMKNIQGWSDITVTHFRDLAVYGEQILLSVRYGDWIDVMDSDHAANWAREWRPAIQSYIWAYRAATGVDLTSFTVSSQVDATIPAVHLQNRLMAQQRAR